MTGFFLILMAICGCALARRRKRGNIVRIDLRTPFPPYDWFAKEQGPEEAYPPHRGDEPEAP